MHDVNGGFSLHFSCKVLSGPDIWSPHTYSPMSHLQTSFYVRLLYEKLCSFSLELFLVKALALIYLVKENWSIIFITFMQYVLFKAPTSVDILTQNRWLCLVLHKETEARQASCSALLALDSLRQSCTTDWWVFRLLSWSFPSYPCSNVFLSCHTDASVTHPFYLVTLYFRLRFFSTSGEHKVWTAHQFP